MLKRKKNRHHSALAKKSKPRGGKRKSDIWRKLLKFLPSVLVAVMLVFLFSKLGPLHKFQTFVSDTTMRIDHPAAHSDVALVEITDYDYQSLFRRESPLDPLQLHRLIDAIARSHPQLIAVDIDTSPEKYRTINLESGWPPIVWERDVERIPENEDEKLKLTDRVLGRTDERLFESSGVPVFFDDPEDGMTRRYTRYLETEDDPAPTLPQAIFMKADRPSSTEPSRTKFFIRYTGSIDETRRLRQSQGTWMSASELIERSERPEWSESAENHLRGKIVLLGGTYGDDDLHYTPVGRMYGVQIIAQVLETELKGGGDRAPSKAAVMLLELFECVAVVLLFHAFHTLGFFRVIGLSLVSVIIVAIACSLLSFGSLTRATTFMPVLLCVLLYEFAIEYRAEVVKKLSTVGTPEPAD